MKITPMLVPDKVKPKYNVNGKQVTFPMDPEYITIHETANTAKGANDLAHAKLQLNGNSRQASWHLQVDEDSCYQSLPFNEAGIHAGDGTYGDGNRKSIGIEICVNSDGIYEKAVENAANVTAQLMKRFNIPISKVVTHKHWSGKNCPTKLLPRWKWFISLVEKEFVKLGAKEVSKDMDVLKQPMQLNSREWEDVEKTYNMYHKAGILTSDIWRKKAIDKTLTYAENMYLLTVCQGRFIEEQLKKKE